MRLFLRLALGLVAAAHVVLASSPTGLTVHLERRNFLLNDDNTVNFKAVANHAKQLSHKYNFLMKKFKDNMGKDHPLLNALVEALSKRGEGEVGLTDIRSELLWAGEIQFGNSKFKIDFDTGSADTLVNPGAYEPHKSSSSKKTSDEFETSYADNTRAVGTIYTDDMVFGGLKAKNVAIGLSRSKFSDDGESVGIAGLGFPSIQAFPKKYDPIFVALMHQKAVAEPVFQFTLKPGTGSTLHLGGVDYSKVKDKIDYVNVNPDDGFWITDGSVQGVKTKFVIDSGTTLIIGPMDQVLEVISKLPGVTPHYNLDSLQATFDCSHPPTVDFEINGKKYKLDKQQASYGTSFGRCVLSIMGQRGLPMHAWVLGDAFMQGVSVVFDMGRNRMGFALST